MSTPLTAERWVRARGDQVGHGQARVLFADQALADEHGVRPARGVGQQVTRPADAGLGDLDDPLRDPARYAAEDPAVNLERGQVARVDADHGGAGVERAVEL